MQLLPGIRDLQTGLEWSQLGSCWWQILFCVADRGANSTDATSEKLQLAIMRFFDRGDISDTSPLSAVRLDHDAIALFWCSADACSVNRATMLQALADADFGSHYQLVHMVGSPFVEASFHAIERTPVSSSTQRQLHLVA